MPILLRNEMLMEYSKANEQQLDVIFLTVSQ